MSVQFQTDGLYIVAFARTSGGATMYDYALIFATAPMYGTIYSVNGAPGSWTLEVQSDVRLFNFGNMCGKIRILPAGHRNIGQVRVAINAVNLGSVSNTMDWIIAALQGLGLTARYPNIWESIKEDMLYTQGRIGLYDAPMTTYHFVLPRND